MWVERNNIIECAGGSINCGDAEVCTGERDMEFICFADICEDFFRLLKRAKRSSKGVTFVEL